MFAETVHTLTGRLAVAIQTQEYDYKFVGTFNPDDPHAAHVRISNPPTADDLQRLRDAGVTHILAGPVGLEIAQTLCRELELPLFGPDRRVLTDKAQLQNVLREAGQPYIPGQYITGLEEAVSAYLKLGPEVVVKPNEGFGTVGVSFVSTPDGINQLATSFEKGALIETRIPGVEYFIDIVSFFNPTTQQTEHRFMNAARYRKVTLVTNSPIYSSIRILPFEGIVQSRLIAQSREALNTFNMHYGLTHAEFMMMLNDPEAIKQLVEGHSLPAIESTNKIYPIEFNFRMPGGQIPYLLRKYALAPESLNQAEAAVLAIHDPARLASTPEGWKLVNHLDVSFLFAPRKGRFNLKAVEALQSMFPDAIKEVALPKFAHGEEVSPTSDLFDALGKVVIAHPSDEVVTRVSHQIYEMSMRGEFLLPQ